LQRVDLRFGFDSIEYKIAAAGQKEKHGFIKKPSVGCPNSFGCASATQAAAQTKESPTVEQCRADASRWAASPFTYKDWSIEVIDSALKEMLYCDMDYPHDSAQPQFAQLQHRLQDALATRYQHFIDRHGLFNLFLEEDAKGER
jgi:hypothetical protein